MDKNPMTYESYLKANFKFNTLVQLVGIQFYKGQKSQAMGLKIDCTFLSVSLFLCEILCHHNWNTSAITFSTFQKPWIVINLDGSMYFEHLFVLKNTPWLKRFFWLYVLAFDFSFRGLMRCDFPIVFFPTFLEKYKIIWFFLK